MKIITVVWDVSGWICPVYMSTFSEECVVSICTYNVYQTSQSHFLKADDLARRDAKRLPSKAVNTALSQSSIVLRPVCEHGSFCRYNFLFVSRS